MALFSPALLGWLTFGLGLGWHVFTRDAGMLA
jgi:hypothetical protein